MSIIMAQERKYTVYYFNKFSSRCSLRYPQLHNSKENVAYIMLFNYCEKILWSLTSMQKQCSIAC